jgi:hypothetical protein
MKILRLLAGMILAGLAFWFPDMVWHAVRGYNFGAIPFEVIPVNIVMILSGLWIQEKLTPWTGPRLSGVAYLLGIVLLGPWCLAVSASFTGGGFLSGWDGQFLFFALLLFVPFTFIGSTYDGSLFAVVIGTVYAIYKIATGRKLPILPKWFCRYDSMRG